MAVRLQLPSDGTREVGLRHLAGPAAALDALMGIGPPLLELGTLDENAAPPSLDIHCTTDPLRRSAWVVRRTRAPSEIDWSRCQVLKTQWPLD